MELRDTDTGLYQVEERAEERTPLLCFVLKLIHAVSGTGNEMQGGK